MERCGRCWGWVPLAASKLSPRSLTTPVKNIGLAAVSLLGLSTGLELDGQRAIYEAGATAIACLIQVDAALDDAKSGVEGSGGAAPTGATPTGPEILANTEPKISLLAAQQNLAAEIMSAGPTAPSGRASPQDALTASAKTLALDTLTNAKAAQHEDTQLKAAVASTTDPVNRAAALSTALNQIKTAVADQLYKNVDVTKIYDAAKKGYQSLVGNVPSTQQSTKKAASNASGPGMSALSTLAVANGEAPSGSPAGPNTDVGKVQQAVKQATKDAAATQKVADTYDSCVGKASPQPAAQPKPSSPTQPNG